MQNSSEAPPPRKSTEYPSGTPRGSFIRATASSTTGWKSFALWLISANDKPLPLKSKICFAVFSMTSRGSIEGPALKLYFFIMKQFKSVILFFANAKLQLFSLNQQIIFNKNADNVTLCHLTKAPQLSLCLSVWHLRRA